MSFTMEWNSNKYVEISMTKIFQDLYGKTYGNLLGNFKEDLSRCQDIPCTCTGKCDIMKM